VMHRFASAGWSMARHKKAVSRKLAEVLDKDLDPSNVFLLSQLIASGHQRPRSAGRGKTDVRRKTLRAVSRKLSTAADVSVFLQAM